MSPYAASGYWRYLAPDHLEDPAPGELVQPVDNPGALSFHAIDADGVDRSDVFAILQLGDIVRVGPLAYTVQEAASAPAGEAWNVDTLPDTMAGTLVGEAVYVTFTTGVPLPVPPAPPARPVADLGPRDVYAPLSDLDAQLGGPGDSSAADRRALCLIIATRWVAYRVGAVVTDDTLDPTIPLEVQAVPARPAWRQATVAAAVRFWQSPTVPFGVAGGWDMATYVRMSIPDVDLLLYGQRARFGIA